MKLKHEVFDRDISSLVRSATSVVSFMTKLKALDDKHSNNLCYGFICLYERRY